MADSPGIIVKQCAQCDEWFTSNEDIAIRDGKPFHPRCVQNYVLNKEIQQFKINHPYLNDGIVSKLIESIGYNDAINIFNDNPWVVITGNSEEAFAHPTANQTEMDAFISNHHESPDEPYDEIISIWNNGQEYNYSLDITVTLNQV